MEKKLDKEYMHALYQSFKKLPLGNAIEIEIEKLGATKYGWEIPQDFRDLFESLGARIEPVEIINRSDNQRRFTYMMYKMGPNYLITFVNPS